MEKNKSINTKMTIAQSCDSQYCKKKFKEDIIKNFSELITTPHSIDLINKKLTCLYCGKLSKFK